jgi:hypothetical protein
MLEKVTMWWRRWRESSRQHAIDRALYKAGGGRGARDGGARGTAGGNQPPGGERVGGIPDSGGGDGL